MVDQEKLNERGNSSTSPPRQSSGGDDILSRMVALAELQAELFRIDLRAGLQKLILSCILLGGVGAMSAASLCIALMFIAESLVDGGGLNRSAALIITAVVGLISTIGLIISAGLCLRASLRVFDRSREEWSRTIQWIKRILRHPISADMACNRDNE
jgi:hypothetical protein